MHQERENLDIIFRKTMPERVLRTLEDQNDSGILSYSGREYLRIAYGNCVNAPYPVPFLSFEKLR